ncbi:MAG: tetratricopeptide repeat protein [Polyangiaceae bacterium]|nr:tetratricopeptide repeat protein [Polyangiaceae bacterium]
MADGFHSRRRGQAAKAGAVLCSIAVCTACSSVAQNPAQNPEAQSHAEYDLARDSYKNGKLREVLAHVQKALEHDETNADAAFLGASVHLQFCAADETSADCRWEDAEKYARHAIEANPELRDAKNMLGVILVHRGRYEEAVTVLKPLANDILYNYPENAWGNLGWAYLLQGNSDEAIDALRRSIAAQPLFCVGAYRLGLAYEKKGDFGAAREAFTKAVETQAPDCGRLQDAFDARARVGSKLGLRDEVRADLTKCIDIGKQTPVGKKCAEQLRAMQ